MINEKQYHVAINTNTSGDNTLITAPLATVAPGAYLAIDFLVILPTQAVTVTFKSGTTAYSGPMPLDAKQTISLDNAVVSQYGTITCAANEDFVMNLSGAVQVGG